LLFASRFILTPMGSSPAMTGWVRCAACVPVRVKRSRLPPRPTHHAPPVALPFLHIIPGHQGDRLSRFRGSTPHPNRDTFVCRKEGRTISMDEDGPWNRSQSDDDFQRAVAAAQAETGKSGWSAMPPSEQARAIYEHLRAIDAERAASLFILPARRGDLRAKTNASDVSHRRGPAPQSQMAFEPLTPSVRIRSDESTDS